MSYNDSTKFLKRHGVILIKWNINAKYKKKDNSLELSIKISA